MGAAVFSFEALYDISMDGDHEMNGDLGGFRGRGKGRPTRGSIGARPTRGGRIQDERPQRAARGPEDRVFDRLQALAGQPTHELSEKAKTALDGKVLKNRTLKVRFAAHGAALRLKNLSPWVSNELLERGFSVFGEIEKAVHIVDAKGKPTGEGIVEFVSKPAANMALKMCTEGCFFLTTSPKPVIVELLTEEDNEEGYPEKTVPKRNQEFMKERETGPRFAPPGTFEYEYGQSWKALYELDRQKKEALDAEMR